MRSTIFFRVIAFLIACWALASCAVMGDRTVHVTESQIAQKLNERLEVPISLLKIFDVNLSNALVKMDATTGRMKTTLDTHLTSALFKNAISGKVAISGKLRFDQATQSVMLDAPAVEQVDFDGLDPKFSSVISAFSKAMGGELLNGLTLYQVKPEDLKVGNTQYTPKDMLITERGLQLTLSPQ